jgi:6-phosphogluconolactonase (cycloisomerase 2 family)
MEKKMKTVTFCIMLIVIMAYQPVCFGVDINLSIKAQIPGTVVTNIWSGTSDSIISGLTLSPDGSKLYAAYWTDSGSDHIEAYSTSNYSRIDEETMQYGTCHGDVVVSNDGRYVYAPSYYEGNVSRFDRNNGNARTDLSAGEWAGGIFKSPDGTKLIVASGRDGRPYDEGNDYLSIYDIASDQFSNIDSIHMQDELMGFKAAFSNDGKYIYVPTYQRQSSAARLYEVSISGTLGVNRYLEFSGNGLQSVVGNLNTIFVSDSDNKKIWMVDKATWSITDSIDLTFMPGCILLHPDGQHLFVSDNNLISVFDITTKSLISSVSGIPGSITDMELNQDGSLAYASWGNSSQIGGITVINTPEPATLLLLGLGGLGLLRRKRSKA